MTVIQEENYRQSDYSLRGLLLIDPKKAYAETTGPWQLQPMPTLNGIAMSLRLLPVLFVSSCSLHCHQLSVPNAPIWRPS